MGRRPPLATRGAAAAGRGGRLARRDAAARAFVGALSAGAAHGRRRCGQRRQRRRQRRQQQRPWRGLPSPFWRGAPPPPLPSPAEFAITPLPLTPDGYFPTGDLGALSPDGTLHIHDRLTAVLVLASGAKVPPAPVETALRSTLPAVEHALLVTDGGRTRLGVLFALKSRPDGTSPSRSPRLDGPAAAVSARCDTPAAAAAGDGLWAAYLDAGVAAVNAGRALPPGARIAAWAVAADGFSAGRSELTPTRKVRRAVIAAHYAGVIARMFADARGGATSL